LAAIAQFWKSQASQTTGAWLEKRTYMIFKTDYEFCIDHPQILPWFRVVRLNMFRHLSFVTKVKLVCLVYYFAQDFLYPWALFLLRDLSTLTWCFTYIHKCSLKIFFAFWWGCIICLVLNYCFFRWRVDQVLLQRNVGSIQFRVPHKGCPASNSNVYMAFCW
jgi:hypothetical protein